MYLKVSPYKDILEGITTSLQISEGLIKLTGRPRIGKSSLCLELFRQLEGENKKVLYFLSPPKSAEQMQEKILDHLGINSGTNFTKALTAYLMAKPLEKRQLYLIFDDTEKLDDTTFASIRMLCNIQDEQHSLVRPVICGSPALDQRLKHNEYRSVAQYISQSFTLPPMTAEQLKDFYWAWWREQGIEIQPPSARVIASLFRQTKGLPGEAVRHLQQTGERRQEAPTPIHAAELEPALPEPVKARPAESGFTVIKEVPDTAVQVPRRQRQRNTELSLGLFFGVLLLGIGGVMYYLYSSIEDRPAVRTVSSTSPAARPQTVAEPQNVDDSALAAPASAETLAGTEEQQIPPEVAATTEEQQIPPEVTAATEEQQELLQDTTEAPADFAETPVLDEAPAPVAVASEAVEPPTTQERVRDLLGNWLASWERKDLDGYFSHYVPEFVSPYTDTHEQWHTQRSGAISRASDISIAYDRLEIVDESDAAIVVRFWMSYEAGNYADNTWKELELTRTGGGLLIAEERNLQIERTR